MNESLPGLIVLVVYVVVTTGLADTPPEAGLASWYDESHRGKLMANGERFDPGKMTAASWSYPLGTRVRVSLKDSSRAVVVAITDRGPAHRLVREGSIIDLSEAAFAQLADTRFGLISVTVEPVT
jgi:rare lipoprotein A